MHKSVSKNLYFRGFLASIAILTISISTTATLGKSSSNNANLLNPFSWFVRYQLKESAPTKSESRSSREQRTAFFIGNSLTQDGEPWNLDGAVDFHIKGGKGVEFFYRNPTVLNAAHKTGGVSSIPWTEALQDNEYEYVVFEPYTDYKNVRDTWTNTIAILAGGWINEGEEDALYVPEEMAWMNLQPNAQFILHTGWTRLQWRDGKWHQPGYGNKMVHNPHWFDVLMKELEERTGRKITSTYSAHILDTMHDDSEEGVMPIISFIDLFSDTIHMSRETPTRPGYGRQIVHQTFRKALGQPFNYEHFTLVPEEFRSYTRSVIHHHFRRAW